MGRAGGQPTVRPVPVVTPTGSGESRPVASPKQLPVRRGAYWPRPGKELHPPLDFYAERTRPSEVVALLVALVGDDLIEGIVQVDG